MTYDITDATMDALQESQRVCLRCREALTTNLVCDGCYQTAKESAKFHEECGFAWSVHETTSPLTTLPFGCPTELVARLRWGR